MTGSTRAARAGRGERTDAQRNRAGILAAAPRVFARYGVEAPMTTIAEEAGVAVGTIYRHFPSKDALVDAAVVYRLQQITDQAKRAAAQAEEDPWTAFTAFLTALSELCVQDGAFATVISDRAGATGDSRAAEAAMVEAIGALLTRAQQVGALIAEVTPEDMPIVLAGVRRAAQSTDPRAWRRYLAIVIRGLRAPAKDGTVSELAAQPDDGSQAVI